MPMLYTASTISSKKVQNPAFTKKGLDGLTSGRLEQIHQVGLAVEKQVAYDNYTMNLPAFMHATSINAIVSCHGGWYPVKLDSDNVLPLALPPVVVAPRKPFRNEEEKVGFKRSLGEDVDEIRSPREMTFVLRKPTFASLKALPYGDLNTNAQSPSDATSITGLKSYLTTLKIISLFLMTHTYPYKQVATDQVNYYGADTGITWVEGKNWYVHKASPRGVVPAVSKDVALTHGDVAYMSEKDFDLEDTPCSLSNAVVVAKPAPLRPDVNYGVPNSVPNFPGYVLPYFRGLIEPSKSTIVNVVRRYFLGCLSDSKENAGAAWFEWMKGVDKWYQSEAGRVLAHILYNIQTALEAQARLFLIIRGSEYLGCTILGYSSTITVDGKFLVPETPEGVRALAAELDGHSSALVKIAEMVNGRRRDNAMMEVPDDELTTSRKVYKFICESPRVPDSEMEELRDQVSRLSFQDKLWTAMVGNIVRAIELLCCDDPVEDLPMYLDPALIYNDSRAHQVLASFGPIAPSFLEATGTDFAIPKGLEAEDPSSTFDEVTHKRPLETIYVSLKKISVAALDWQNVVKKRRIRINTAKRDAGFRTIEYRGEMRDSIWGALKRLPYEEVVGKRKRTPDDEGDREEGSSKKGKARDVPTTMSFDDLF